MYYIYTNNHIHTYVSVHWTYIIPIIPFLFNAFKHMLASGTKGLLSLKHQMNFVLGQGLFCHFVPIIGEAALGLLCKCQNPDGPTGLQILGPTLGAQDNRYNSVPPPSNDPPPRPGCFFFSHGDLFESLETSKCYWYDAKFDEMYDFRSLYTFWTGTEKFVHLQLHSLSIFLSLWTGNGKYIMHLYVHIYLLYCICLFTCYSNGAIYLRTCFLIILYFPKFIRVPQTPMVKAMYIQHITCDFNQHQLPWWTQPGSPLFTFEDLQIYHKNLSKFQWFEPKEIILAESRSKSMINF